MCATKSPGGVSRCQGDHTVVGLMEEEEQGSMGVLGGTITVTEFVGELVGLRKKDQGTPCCSGEQSTLYHGGLLPGF